MSKDRRILYAGRHLVLFERHGWEFVEHRTAPEAAMIVALTASEEVVLAEEFRPPMNAPVVSLPSGLIGDEGPEEAIDAARRELAEETGHSAQTWERLARGPGSAGQSSEMVTFFLARPAVRSGTQAAHDLGKIRVHVVPVDGLPEWSRRREAEGVVIDPKIWAGLYLALGR
jgi:ADP-ribose pyrophosphatase